LSGALCVNGTFVSGRVFLRCVLTFIFCRPAQRGVQDWKSRISIRSFDSPECNASMPLPPHIQSAIPPASHPRHENSSPSLTSHLCYACHTTLTSRSSRGTALQSKISAQNYSSPTTPLPVWVSSRLLKSDDVKEGPGGSGDENTAREVWQSSLLGANEMRDAVKDFLLED
jgi:cytoplasmic tRNA 2-thiolation protein 2